eukprot:3792003-Rhodomonas_salina.1
MRSWTLVLACVALAVWSPRASAFLLPGSARLALSSHKKHAFTSPQSQRLAAASPLQRRAVSQVMMSSDSKGVATGYAVTGLISAATWLAVSYVALSFHPNPAVNAACGFRHNALTMAQAWALPLPVGWAVFKALHSAANVGWDRLSSATYRRLNLGVAACSLWMAAAVAFGPAFAVGYDLFTPALKIGAASLHTATAAFALYVWARTVRGNLLGRLVRGVVGSLWALGPQRSSDDPDKPDGGAALFAFATAGLLVFAVRPLPPPSLPSLNNTQDSE